MSGLLDLADGRGTKERHLSAILRAQRYNQAMGGAVITPWEIEELPGDWKDALQGIAYQVEGLAKGRKAVAERVAALKKEHGWKQ